MKDNILRIGTRGSKLAVYQAETVKAEILERFPKLIIDIHIIKTKGDKILDTALSKIGDKGLFTKEIELAILKDEVDIAVHSLKDLSTELPDELQLTAVLKRGEYRDALVHKNHKKIKDLDSSDTIATSSLRRIASLKHINPKIKIVDIRGNVNTRIEKMMNGHCDGMIMAAAGLQRLGLEEYITEIIDSELIIPAAAQGAIAIESRINDSLTNEILSTINHPQTLHAVMGERKFLNSLQGGCQVPIGCYSKNNMGTLTLTGFVADLSGNQHIKSSISGDITSSVELGRLLAEELIGMGANKVLDEIRKQN